MRIALVNITDNGISGKGYSAPLGLSYIGAIAKKIGLDVRGYDLCVSKDTIEKYYLKTDYNFLNSISNFKPDLIGMTCSTTNRINLSYWADIFKKNIPYVVNIVGGPHPYFFPEKYMLDTKQVDFLVLGEGEKTFDKLIKAYMSESDLSSIEGIAFRTKEGNVIVNPSGDVIDNLDEIDFPARDLFPMKEYDIKFGTVVGNAATIITSRGCGNICKFCCTSNYWKKVRFRSANNVLDEIESIISEFPYINNFIFFDDTFTSKRQHAVSICEEIIKRKLKINWACWSRTNILDDAYFGILKEAGCTTLSYGIESGNDLMLKVIRKNSTVEKNYKALTIGEKHGICTRGTMIGGMPEEKLEWAVDSIFFMAYSGVSPKDLRMSLYTYIFPGTYWEEWFKNKYSDFSWEAIPPRFNEGSFVDSSGNIVLPCYRWKGLPYWTLVVLLKTVQRSKIFRKILSFKLIQNIIRFFIKLFLPEYPQSIYDK